LRNAAVTVLMAVVLIVGAGAGYYAGVSNKTTTTSVSTLTGPTATTTQSVTYTTTNTLTSVAVDCSSSTSYATGIDVFSYGSGECVVVNGTAYNAEDVWPEIVFNGQVGQFKNQSILFDGVVFSIEVKNTTETAHIIVTLNMTFNDGKTLSVNVDYNQAPYALGLSHYNPTAGILVIQGGCPPSPWGCVRSYRIFLLVW
jgi:hypothetical protein